MQEAQVASRLAAMLSERAEDAAHDISERLRVAREQAVARAREKRMQTVPVMQSSRGAVVLGSSGPAAVMGEQPSWWFRLASVLPLLLLVAGLWFVDTLNDEAQIDAAAEVDLALLTDDLPPAAYADPAFLAYLKKGERQ